MKLRLPARCRIAGIGTLLFLASSLPAAETKLTVSTPETCAAPVFGWSVAIYPALWIHLFSDDAAVIEIGSLYMRIVAPFYPLFGAGLALYFASQGAGQMLLPMLANTARLLLVAAGGALVMQLGGPLWALFAVIALGLSVVGGLTGLVVFKARWART